ncbi:MAG: Ni/Fe-hydrogenase cytochrome b subunit [Fimbriimonadales bacterium]|nr:Ni/Fe-hydrogenase cytochrome b subunit [Fimbriimonadales bacterium]
MKRLALVPRWWALAALILAVGAYALWIRFTQGLGGASNLHDTFPWGFWVGIDVLVGVGLAAGGFTIAATVYVLNLKKYEPVSRPSLLTAFLGYLLVTAALVVDIGRPLRLWHPLIMWNPHSVMFEVAWCVTLYTTVLALEFSPLVFEKLGWHWPLRAIRAIYLPLVIAGVLLSTLHQSSLGTLFLIVPEKLHGLWYSPVLPAFFFVSAVAAGLSMSIIESFISSKVFSRRLEHDVLLGIARVTVVVLAVYVTWRFADLIGRGMLPLAFVYSQQSVMFWAEIGFGAILPLMLILASGDKIKERNLFFYALLVVGGFVLNRVNVSMTGMRNIETYFPKWSEVAITMMIITVGILLFGLAVRHLNVLAKSEYLEPGTTPGMGWFPRGAVTAVAVFFVVLVLLVRAAPTRTAIEAQAKPIPAAEALNVQPDFELSHLPKDLTLSGPESSMGKVIFSHELHVGMQEKPDCMQCHANTFGLGFQHSPKLEGQEAWHKACGTCHDGKTASSSVDDETGESCASCHKSE